MNEGALPARLILLLGAASILFVLEFALSIALASALSLGRVALRRLSSEAESRFGFLEDLQRPPSRHRTAAVILRQLSLLGAVLFLILATREAGLGRAEMIGIGAGAAIGVLFLDALAAPSIAAWNPRLALRFTAFSIRGAGILLVPFVQPVQRWLRWIGTSRQLSDEEREEEQEEEVEALIEVGEREGLLEAKEGEMMRGIVDLDETPVREIMTPRTDIVALPVETSVARARRTFLDAGHSRLPVYRESIDNVVGVLHSRDLYRAWEDSDEEQPISRYLRAASFVPESLPAGELLAEMRQKSHLSLVVDEYGGTAGLVTLEDLLEEIVGEIRDEHEDEEEPVREQADGSYVINAVTHVKELENLFDIGFEEREFDTVGGLVVFGFGRVPSAGEVLEIHGLRVEVLQAERRRVLQVRVRPVQDQEPGDVPVSR